MTNVIEVRRHWQRRGTAADWISVNPVLASGEFGYETDTGFLKIGDGIAAWNSLAYIFAGGGGGGGGGGALELITTSTVSGAAATLITISGLDLATDGCYLGLLSAKNNNASALTVNLFYNGDTTATNYWRQYLVADGSAVSAARSNNANLLDVKASAGFTAEFTIQQDVDGRPRARARDNRDAPSSLVLQIADHVRDNTANVTSLTLSASSANGFAIGTKLSLYKLMQ
ncbi:hyaluronate lyase N-terminal domain-containing protein [Lysobacter terrae]